MSTMVQFERIADSSDPEVVYPRKAEHSDVRPSTKPYRRVLEERRHRPQSIEVSAEIGAVRPQGSRPPEPLTARRGKTRVHFAAPVQNVSGVYTAEDYSHYGSAVNGVTNLSGDKDFDTSISKEVGDGTKHRDDSMKRIIPRGKTTRRATTPTTPRPTTTTTSKPQQQRLRTTSVKSESVILNTRKSETINPNGFRGRSFVAEVDPDQKRTTMAESAMGVVKVVESTTPETSPPPTTSASASTTTAASTSTTTTSIVNGFVRIKAQPRLIGLNGTKSVQADPSKNSTEKRFPAQDWQLPPSLKKVHRVDGGSVAPRNFINNFNTGVNQNQWDQNQPPRYPYLLDSRPRPLYSPFQAMTSALTQNYDDKQPLPLPRPGYQPPAINLPPRPDELNASGGNRNRAQKYRATFAKHNDVVKPIPLPSFPISEDDMDLLTPSSSYDVTEVPVLSPRISMQLRLPNYQAYGEEPLPVPISPVAINGGPVPAAPLPLATGSGASGLDPNGKLALCCQKRQLGPSCQMLCNFDTFNDRTLISTFLTNTCPDPQRALAFECATTKVDHTECCARNGLQTYAGGQCMPFCATHVPTPPNVFSYLPCLQVFNVIKTCYKDYQYTHPNILGD
uniref:DB domain-containing protein n=1 Tax=Panagrellus redivivus TaxID=6233 RepID=A0A7E4W2H2_PANRE